LKITFTVSTGAKIVVWRENDLFHAWLKDTTDRPQVCIAVDLFEVLAELAGLDLEDGRQAAEALSLAEQAQARLTPSDPEVQPPEQAGGETAHSERAP
jgi:hypothetical protein